MDTERNQYETMTAAQPSASACSDVPMNELMAHYLADGDGVRDSDCPLCNEYRKRLGFSRRYRRRSNRENARSGDIYSKNRNCLVAISGVDIKNKER